MRSKPDRRRSWGVALLAIGLVAGVLVWWGVASREGPERPTSGVEAGQPAGVAPARPPELQANGAKVVTGGSQASVPSGASRLRGRVLDDRDSSPVEQAFLFATSGDGWTPAAAAVRSGAGGLFEFELPPTEGAANYRVVANGFVPGSFVVGPNATEARDREYVVRLTRGASVTVRVFDAAGDPVEGADVWCTPEANGGGWPRSDRFLDAESAGAAGVTDRDGSFVVTGLVAGRRYVVSAGKRWYEPAEEGFVAAEAGSDPRLVLTQVADLWITVVDAVTKRPIQGANLRAMGDPSAGPALRHGQQSFAGVPMERPDPGTLRSQWLRPPERGAPDPTVRIMASALGYRFRSTEFAARWGAQVRAEVALEPLVEGTAQPVTLGATFQGGRPFTGKLTLWVQALPPATDNTVAGIPVQFEDGISTSALSLFPGRYRSTFAGDGAVGSWWPRPGEPVTIEVPPSGGSERVRLDLKGALLHLRVVDRAGVARRGFGLRVQYADGSGSGHWVPNWDALASSRADGSVVPESIVHVMPQPGFVRADLPGVGAGRVSFDAKSDGASIPLTIVLDDTER